MLKKVDFKTLADDKSDQYHNEIISQVNDHVVRVSNMVEPYPWHYHPNSDETFIGIEHTVIIETFDGVYELQPGVCITIPKGVAHCTRPKDQRSINLTVESSSLETILLSAAEIANRSIQGSGGNGK